MTIPSNADGSIGRDSVTALASLYEAERTEVQNILQHSLSLVSIFVAYSTVIGAVWATRPETVPHSLLPIVPLPALMVISWHSQLNSRVYAHNQGIFVLEQRLLDKIPSISRPTRLWIGHTSGRLVNEIPILLKEKRYAMAAASFITYGGFGAIALSLTIASVVVPIFINRDWQVLAGAMAVVYVAIWSLLVASYRSTFKVNLAKMDEWVLSAHDAFPELFKTKHGYEETS